ncbi:MAG: M23 family metallopeptidase [Anaerolineales bacterium]|nr:M23 family metallopeptidase [Anaerolineales bacterium]
MQFKNSRTVILLALILSACAGGQEPTPTPVTLREQSQPEVRFDAAQTPSPVPFQFSLPTPGAEPISGWRPPLYPIPWAMSPYDHFYFARPIAADQVNWPIPDYRYGGIFFAPNIVHTGIDIPTPEGAPIMAAGAGTVVWASWGLFSGVETNDEDPYGLAVAIRHDFGYKDQKLYTIYAHMSKIIARLDQHVETGDVIGLVGATGETTGPHVHFEVRLKSNSFFYTYNPELWIAPPQGWGVLTGLVTDKKGKTLQQIEARLESVETDKIYLVKTYGGGGAINRDPYYDENLVLSDLPAGFYKVTITYEKKHYQTWVEIFPGQVTYFTFAGENGFDLTRPSAPILKSLPEVLPATPTAAH